MKKIVVTGMGAVTPVGIGVENYWNNITAGASGIDTIKTFDPSELAVQIAGEVKNFNPSDYLPKDLIRKTDPFMQYAYIAAEEAMKQSGIKIEPERTGIVMGTAMAGIATIATIPSRDELIAKCIYSGGTYRRITQKGRSSFYSQNSRKHCRRKYRNRLQYSGTELYGKHSLFVRR